MLRLKKNPFPASPKRFFSRTKPGQCGVFAVLARRKIPSKQVNAALTALKHRGPESHGTWSSSDGKIVLGHARLSIIDIEGGQQPLSSPSGDLHFVVNGEIYDYKQHIENLSAHYQFKTKSDSECVLALYQKYGIKGCVEKLRGEFAIIGWDAKLNRFYAIRDRFGIKPLYYAVHNGEVHVASEIKALLAYGVPAVWDDETTRQTGGWNFHESRTYFKNIFTIPPGHYLQTSPGGPVEIKQYWDFSFNSEYCPKTKEFRYDESRTPEECIKQLREELLDSIQTRLIADVPVGVYLSGGLDSCSILGMASHLMGQNNKIQSFSISFDGESYDEAQIASRMAAHVGTEPNVLKASSEILTQRFPEAVYHLEGPIANIGVVGKYVLSEHVRDQGYKVVLTGEGSDELFGGYGFFQTENYLRGGFTDQQKELYRNYMAGLSSATQFWSDTAIGGNYVENYLGYTPYVISSILDGFTTSLSRLTPDPVYSKADQVNLFGSPHLCERMRSWHPTNIALYLWAKTGLPNYLLTALGDRMEMAHSVEGRVPFLDHQLVEFVTKLPTNIKLQPQMDKWILREAAKPFLTEEVYNRKKHPFMGPPQCLRGTPFYEYINELLRSPKTCPKVADHKKVVAFLDENHTVAEQGKTVLWDVPYLGLGSLAILEQKYNIQADS